MFERNFGGLLGARIGASVMVQGWVMLSETNKTMCFIVSGPDWSGTGHVDRAARPDLDRRWLRYRPNRLLRSGARSAETIPSDSADWRSSR